MINVILVASSKPRVGKSELSYTLEKTLPNAKRLAFAEPIKEIFYNLYSDVLSRFNYPRDYSILDYKQIKKDRVMSDNIFFTSPRDQYCKGSIFLAELTSPDIWGKLAVVNVNNASEEGYKTVIFDDWRRNIEKESLTGCENLNIITVYLDKPDVPEHVGTEATAQFEGKINPTACDIFFEFNEDWSNQDQLLEMIKEKLKV